MRADPEDCGGDCAAAALGDDRAAAAPPLLLRRGVFPGTAPMAGSESDEVEEGNNGCPVSDGDEDEEICTT